MTRIVALLRPLLLYPGVIACLFTSTVIQAQNCPPNIDFESGTFDGWSCYVGRTVANGTTNEINLFPSGPMPGVHTLIPPNSGMDLFGNFPVNCPNGSGYTLKLGNDRGGGEAEGISYEFTIPAGQDVYSLIYHYAVVFQDPNHEEYQQPRMVVEITNVTDNKLIDCSSFSFIPYGSVLPGFFISSQTVDDGTPVWCKDWSAVSINLNGHAGKTIRLFFKTADCTFRRHFGYAYIDVNSECSDEFVGARYCPDDTAVNIVAPYGYQNYTWFNNNFTQQLGATQTIRFSPPPPTGTTIAVQVTPFAGYGCEDTLYAQLINNLSVFANAGRDTSSCNRDPVPIGVIPKPGLVYTWAPLTGLSNPNISNPQARPEVNTNYVLSVRSSGGGCLTTDTVLVRASIIDNEMALIGKPSYCLGNNDSAVLLVNPEVSIQWYRNDVPITGATSPRFRASQTGSYHAHLVNSEGCRIDTEEQPIVIEIPRPGISYPVVYAIENLPLPLESRSFGGAVVWNPAFNLDQPNSVTPTFRGSREQSYTVTIETPAGCVTIDTQMVKTVKQAEVFVPTAFTPNSDGKNDVLRPTLMGVKELRFFRVFNRWGELLYETKTQRVGWDGVHKGKKQASGVVVWVAEVVGVDGSVFQRKGTSALIR